MNWWMDGWMDERIDGWTTLASCCCSFAKSCPTLCNPMDMAGGASVHHYLPEFAQIPVHWVGPSNHLTLCCPLLLLPSVFPSTRERFPGQYESTITFLSLHMGFYWVFGSVWEIQTLRIIQGNWLSQGHMLNRMGWEGILVQPVWP